MSGCLSHLRSPGGKFNSFVILAGEQKERLRPSVFPQHQKSHRQRGWGWTAAPEEGHPEQAAQDRAQAAFEDQQGGGLHGRPQQPVPVPGRPHGEKVIPNVQEERPVLSFSLSPWSCHWAPPRKAWLHLCTLVSDGYTRPAFS